MSCQRHLAWPVFFTEWRSRIGQKLSGGLRSNTGQSWAVQALLDTLETRRMGLGGLGALGSGEWKGKRGGDVMLEIVRMRMDDVPFPSSAT